MSWLFSRALGEEYSEGTSLAGEQFAQLNVMPTPHKFWRNDKTMEFSDLSRFGLTLRLLTENHGRELLMSFLAVFHAKTSALLGEEQELMVSEADYGQKWYGSFARWDPNLFLWKTAQTSLIEDLMLFSETWPRWGSTRNGVAYLRKIPELTTFEKEYGLWPTPTATDRGGRHKPGSHLGLRKAVNGWKKGRVGEERQDKEKPLPNGRLNPEWVEWLMGWPLGWTELKPLEMGKFREWELEHGGF